MRTIGMAEKALELAIGRGLEREAFGKPVLKLGGNGERIAQARIAIHQARLMTLHAAWKIDSVGVKNAMTEISAIKVAADGPDEVHMGMVTRLELKKYMSRNA